MQALNNDTPMTEKWLTRLERLPNLTVKSLIAEVRRLTAECVLANASYVCLTDEILRLDALAEAEKKRADAATKAERERGENAVGEAFNRGQLAALSSIAVSLNLNCSVRPTFDEVIRAAKIAARCATTRYSKPCGSTRSKTMEHQWANPNRVIKHPYCKVCLVIKRADGKNKPCKGWGRLSLRKDQNG